MDKKTGTDRKIQEIESIVKDLGIISEKLVSLAIDVRAGFGTILKSERPTEESKQGVIYETELGKELNVIQDLLFNVRDILEDVLDRNAL